MVRSNPRRTGILFQDTFLCSIHKLFLSRVSKHWLLVKEWSIFGGNFLDVALWIFVMHEFCLVKLYKLVICDQVLMVNSSFTTIPIDNFWWQLRRQIFRPVQHQDVIFYLLLLRSFLFFRPRHYKIKVEL
jgi:hypothetical protein